MHKEGQKSLGKHARIEQQSRQADNMYVCNGLVRSERPYLACMGTA